MDYAFLDHAAWQQMLERDGEGLRPTGVAIGFLQRHEYCARSGTLLVWEMGVQGLRAAFRAYDGTVDSDIGLLFVANATELERLGRDGLTALPLMVRQRRCDQYILKTLKVMEDAGLGDFIEDIGLNFPIH